MLVVIAKVMKSEKEHKGMCVEQRLLQMLAPCVYR